MNKAGRGHMKSYWEPVNDVKELTEYARTLPNVVVAIDNRYTCADPGQEQIRKAIKEHNLNRVVVAACSPRMHEPTFRRCVADAGLNPYLFEMANIREFASWCHQSIPKEATEKAKDIVKMAVAKANTSALGDGFIENAKAKTLFSSSCATPQVSFNAPLGKTVQHGLTQKGLRSNLLPR